MRSQRLVAEHPKRYNWFAPLPYADVLGRLSSDPHKSVLALSKIGLKRKFGGFLDDLGIAGASAGKSGVSTGFIMK